ncbi:unnamed protein product [Schistosoma turkestanicum]|nr:unnamed protein product [Schistosoma turkestanicum]
MKEINMKNDDHLITEQLERLYNLSKRINLKEISLDLEKLKTTGILVDKELDNNGNQIGSLLQIFTEPLFQKDGFFIELIERCNQSTGFGENNINALWEALEISQTNTSN